MAMKDVLESLTDHMRGNFNSNGKLIELMLDLEEHKMQIQELCTIAPEWLYSTKNFRGEFLKMINKRLQSVDIRERILVFYKAKNSKSEKTETCDEFLDVLVRTHQWFGWDLKRH